MRNWSRVTNFVKMKSFTNFKMYLRGLRKYQGLQKCRNSFIFSEHSYSPYMMMSILSLSFAYFTKCYLKYNFYNTEEHRRKYPNLLIPKFVYDSRRQHYVYWELSRLSRSLKKTFTHCNYDPDSKMMYHVGLDGQIYFEKFNFKEERIDLIQNPLLAQYLRYPEQLQQDFSTYRKAIELASYSLNQNKRYDLDVSTHFPQNYLMYKPITVFDWLRSIYSTIMYYTIADPYYYQHLVSKSPFFYNYERIVISLNLSRPNSLDVVSDLLLLEGVWMICLIDLITQKLRNLGLQEDK